MKTNFKEYLEKKNTQKIIEKHAKKYAGKKIVLYGAGFFASELLRNYDLSALDIIGVADMSFQDKTEGDFYGYPKLGAYDLLETNFDIILITTYDDIPIKQFFNNDLFVEGDYKNKIKTFVRMGLFEYIAKVVKGEL